MKLPIYLAHWFKNQSSFKLLFIAAILLLSQAFFSNFYLLYNQKNSVDKNQSMLESILLNSIHQQITPLFVNNQYEGINTVLDKSLELPKIHKIALYRSNGKLIHSATSENRVNVSDTKTQVKKILQDKDKLGFLIIDFYAPQSTLPLLSDRYWLFIIALSLWFIFALLILLSHRSINRKKSNFGSLPVAKVASYKQELQQLLKRNQKTLTDEFLKNSLVIEANWDSLKLKPKQPIISLLNRWTAHNDSVIKDFTDEYLHLGLPDSTPTAQLQQIQTLEISLIKLGLKPKLLIHTLKFNPVFYSTIFSVLDTGIWISDGLSIEGIKQNKNVKSVTIEIEDSTTLLVHLLIMAKSEVRNTIERQSRFYLE